MFVPTVPGVQVIAIAVAQGVRRVVVVIEVEEDQRRGLIRHTDRQLSRPWSTWLQGFFVAD
jgi:hypothetical protein